MSHSVINLTIDGAAKQTTLKLFKLLQLCGSEGGDKQDNGGLTLQQSGVWFHTRILHLKLIVSCFLTSEI